MAHGARFQAGQVRAGLRLGEALREIEVAALDGFQVALLEVVRAEAGDDRPDQVQRGGAEVGRVGGVTFISAN